LTERLLLSNIKPKEGKIMEYKDRYEQRVVEKVEALGLYLGAISPHANYEVYHFYHPFDSGTVMVEFGYYERDKFMLKVGKDNNFTFINDKFTLSEKELIKQIEAFCKKNRVVKKPHDPKVD
jgi:hypothetical protein